MTTNDYLQAIVFVYGLTAVLYAFGWGLYFYRVKRGISRVISFMLFGEAFGLAIAVKFAWDSLMGNYAKMDIETVMTLRVLFFSAAYFTTIHLVMYLRYRHQELIKERIE